MMTPEKAKIEAGQTLKDITFLLQKSNMDFAYRPDLDNYSGILLYDMGDQQGFVAHAKKIAKKIINTDPHTAYALKELFPKYTGISFPVQPEKCWPIWE